MPAISVAVDKNQIWWQVRIVVYDESQVDHGFMAFVHRNRETWILKVGGTVGSIWVNGPTGGKSVRGDMVWI